MTPRWFATIVFFTVLTLLVASQVFWFRRARSFVRSRPKAWQRWLVGVPVYAWFYGLAAMVVLVSLRWLLLQSAPVLLSFFMVLRQPAVMVPVGLWISASYLSFLLIQLVRGGGWLFARFRPARAVEVSGNPDGVAVGRRYFLQTATYAAGAVPFVMVGYGFLLGRHNYRVEEVTVALPDLPEPLDGLRLLQLTDVHASAYMPVKEIRRVVGLARELDPDLVFHTGDFITSRGDPLAEAIAELGGLQGRYGSFGCLGNHEDYAGTQEATTELFARQGVRILRGQNAEVEIRGAKLNLIGVDYQRHTRGPGPELSKRDWLRGVERLVQPEALNILLCHNPNPFVRATELGIELMLAGHTHGGQVQVEILDSRWSPARFITPFISGLYSRPSGRAADPVAGATGLGATGRGLAPSPDSLPRQAFGIEGPPVAGLSRTESRGHCFLYVSRGIGTIAAPIRLGAPPEITLLTLRRS